jgi:ribosome-binding protein aMBF1 (putative translation factor)
MAKPNYGRLIEQHCQNANIRYAEFAEQIGVTVRTIFRWVSGEAYPTYKFREKLDEILEVKKVNPENDDTETFVINPVTPSRRRNVIISEEYYEMLREMSLISDCKITHACEQAIQFAYDRFGGEKRD